MMQIRRGIVIYAEETGSSSPLRTAEEIKGIDTALKKRRDLSLRIEHRPSSSLHDVVRILGEGQYDLVHVSAHGMPDGLQLSNGGVRYSLSPDELAHFLQRTQPNLRALFLSSCYSSDARAALAKVADDVLLLHDAAGDEACIRFAEQLYTGLALEKNFPDAATAAISAMRFLGYEGEFKAALFPRPANPSDLIVTAATLWGRIRINLSPVKDQLELLGSTDEIIDAITRKINLHARIFQSSAERSVILFDQLCGLFSWPANPAEITCHKLVMLDASKAPPEAFVYFFQLTLGYGKLSGSRYRVGPSAPLTQMEIRKTLTDFDHYSEVMGRLVGNIATDENNLQVLHNQVRAAIEEAHWFSAQEDDPDLQASLEIALSNIHSCLITCVRIFSLPLTTPDE